MQSPSRSFLAVALLAGAKFGEEVARRLGQPAVVGELLGGFVVGPYAPGFAQLGEAFKRKPLFADTPLVPSFPLILGLALLGAAIGLAAIVGAFVAGLIVAATEDRDELQREIRPLATIFAPFFFAVTGAQLDLAVLLDPAVAILALGLAIAGIATKLLGGILAVVVTTVVAPYLLAWAIPRALDETRRKGPEPAA